MTRQSDPRLVRDVEVVCAGPKGSPHPLRLLALPTDQTVTCEECGLRYRRAPDWKHITRAHWPKAE